jgi:hypothetical protein
LVCIELNIDIFTQNRLILILAVWHFWIKWTPSFNILFRPFLWLFYSRVWHLTLVRNCNILCKYVSRVKESSYKLTNDISELIVNYAPLIISNAQIMFCFPSRLRDRFDLGQWQIMRGCPLQVVHQSVSTSTLYASRWDCHKVVFAPIRDWSKGKRGTFGKGVSLRIRPRESSGIVTFWYIFF